MITCLSKNADRTDRFSVSTLDGYTGCMVSKIGIQNENCNRYRLLEPLSTGGLLICLFGIEKINLAELPLSNASIFYPATINKLTYKKLL
jgi:hypothetical protein